MITGIYANIIPNPNPNPNCNLRSETVAFEHKVRKAEKHITCPGEALEHLRIGRISESGCKGRDKNVGTN